MYGLYEHLEQQGTRLSTLHTFGKYVPLIETLIVLILLTACNHETIYDQPQQSSRNSTFQWTLAMVWRTVILLPILLATITPAIPQCCCTSSCCSCYTVPPCCEDPSSYDNYYPPSTEEVRSALPLLHRGDPNLMDDDQDDPTDPSNQNQQMSSSSSHGTISPPDPWYQPPPGYFYPPYMPFQYPWNLQYHRSITVPVFIPIPIPDGSTPVGAVGTSFRALAGTEQPPEIDTQYNVNDHSSHQTVHQHNGRRVDSSVNINYINLAESGLGAPVIKIFRNGEEVVGNWKSKTSWKPWRLLIHRSKRRSCKTKINSHPFEIWKSFS